MTSLSSSAEESPASSFSDLRAVGFTEGQAAAIRAAVEATAADAFDALRDDLMRWHLYIALYLIAQISIALLAGLVLQNLQSRPSQFGIKSDDACPCTARNWDDDISLLPTKPWPSADQASPNAKSGLPSGLTDVTPLFRRNQKVPKSLKTKPGTVYHDSTGNRQKIDSDSTLNGHAHTSESAATSERHHAPRLVCRRQRLESECAYPPSRTVLVVPPSARIRAIRRDIPHHQSA